MRWQDDLPVTAALLLAIMAAVMSSRLRFQQDLSNYLNQVFAPQMVDLGKYSTTTGESPTDLVTVKDTEDASRYP